MRANEAPERLYLSKNIYSTFLYQVPDPDDETAVEYTRTDAFIEKALKWYCLDCACNDNCKYKCAFWDFFKDYLEGNDKALPPKIENAFNPDGSTTENYRYRQFRARIQDAFIEKAVKFLKPTVYVMCRGIQQDSDEYIKDFKNYMKGE